MNSAYVSNTAYGGTEDQFHHAKAFHTHIRSISLPKYYTLVNKEEPLTTRWRLPDITLGKIFSENGEISNLPILFARFCSEGGKFLARSPISTASLLEASAMAQEVIASIALIKKLDKDSETIEGDTFSKKIIQYLYNHEITEYSVCVHLVANHTLCKDVFIAFMICSILVRIALNFPRKAFERVLEVCDIAKTICGEDGDEFTKRLKAGVESKDICIIFFLLQKSLPRNSAQSQKKADDGILKALENLGLSLEELQDWIGEEASALSKDLIESKVPSISLLGKAGIKNIEKIDLLTAALPWWSLDLPPSYLHDFTAWSPFNSKSNELASLNLDDFLNEMAKGDKWVENFSEACL